MPQQRFWRKRAVKLALSTAAGTAIIVGGLPHVAYGAALSGTIAITTPTTGKLAAATAKQVLTLTVTGQTLSEALVTSVDLGPDCLAVPTYIVTSPTTIAVKTPTAGCAATTVTAGDNIVINFAGGNTLTKTGGLFFITPPAIAAAASKPVITENSALLNTTDQVQRVLAAGGQTVRVKAASTYAFDPRTAQGLAVTFGGKAVTDLKVYDDSGSAPVLVSATATSAPAAGNFMTFKTGVGMSSNDASLTITQGGVSKTFAASDTGASVVAVPTVTSLSVTSGRSKGATSTVLTTSALPDKDVTHWQGGSATWAVNFCGKAGTVTAVNTAGTGITVTTPDVSDDANGLGTGVFAGSCPVTIVDQTVSGSPVVGPVTPGGYFNFLNE
ncbi:hypothetical protein [Dactylosporangium sp. NPDC051541]|uniref:hypothetical protein n=1 Tax=Dactylosporangium sp. NPDC051541 TaxID=3363977 RepID=UPI0037883DB2